MPFRELVELSAERLGAAVVWANDEFFAPKENLLKPTRPVFREGEYTAQGKWMDGWETRRRRTPGYDWCLLRLGLAGIVRGVVVDTSHFKGNYPEQCSLDACAIDGRPDVDRLLAASWREILPESPLKGDSENLFPVDDRRRSTHLRFKIYPDGGVARLRVYGEVLPNLRFDGEIDLAAVENGGMVIAASDMFFGSRHNLIMPGRARDMSDGWETRRRRGAGYDWVILKLCTAGNIARVEVDTSWFKGNFPESCSLEGCDADGVSMGEILPRTLLQPHTRHFIEEEIRPNTGVRHVRFNIFPDGGVSRLRLFGAIYVRSFTEAELLACCGCRAWAQRFAAEQPFRNAGELLAAADRQWWELGRDHWLEAFAAHPRIGESTADRRMREEQAGVDRAAPEILDKLREANRAYEQKFGYIYIVCATGKSAGEMLQILESRLSNDPDFELRVAAGEQRKITRLRLEKLIREP